MMALKESALEPMAELRKLTFVKSNALCKLIGYIHSSMIATNTPLSREGLSSDPHLCAEQGGLSGRPLTRRSTEVIRFLHQKSDGKIPIIGVGGIYTPEDAIEKLEAGASLLQLYTGFIYEGPAAVKRINKALIGLRS